MNTICIFLFIHSIILPSLLGSVLSPRLDNETLRVFLHQGGVLLFSFGTRAPAGETLAGGPICEADVYFYCFLDSVKSINYTTRTVVRLFVSLRSQIGGSLTYFLSVNKKPNHYYQHHALVAKSPQITTKRLRKSVE